jgi:hypothetical protein
MIIKPYKYPTRKLNSNEEKGALNEMDAARFIDFYFKNDKDRLIFHDLIIESSNNRAQIDHLIISRNSIIVLESKFMSSQISIKEDGTWIINNQIEQSIPSPIKQNERHIAVIEDYIKVNNLYPKRLFNLYQTKPEIINVILISPHTDIVKNELYKNTIDTCNYKTLIIKSDFILDIFKYPKIIEIVHHMHRFIFNRISKEELYNISKKIIPKEKDILLQHLKELRIIIKEEFEPDINYQLPNYILEYLVNQDIKNIGDIYDYLLLGRFEYYKKKGNEKYNIGSYNYRSLVDKYGRDFLEILNQ